MLTVEQRIAELWRRGFLSWKLFPDQQEVYAFFADESHTISVVNIARQWGKSFMLCLYSTEYCIKHPGAQVRLVTGSQKALRKIVHPNMRRLLSDCPRNLRPEWVSMDAYYRFPNGSELHLAGANDGHADDSRGQRAHLCVVDEAGFVDDLDYLVSSVLLPQTLTTGGRIILVSTPPVTPAHDFVRFLRKAESEGAAITRTGDQNRHISEEQKAKILAELGGADSTQARREWFCEVVLDAERAVIPEATDAQMAKLVREPEAARWFHPLVALDVGFEDWTAALLGYWDFRRAKLVLQDEVFLRQARTDEIAEAIRAKEAALWPWAEKEMAQNEYGRFIVDPARKERRRTLRYSDVDLRLIRDLAELHDLPFQPTAKDNLEAQVNALRMAVKHEQIEISPKCVNTIRHLKTAIWNKARTAFDRTREDGHFDGVAALVYMWRNCPRHVDPYPRLEGLDPAAQFIPEEEFAPKGNAAVIGGMFGRA